MEFLEINWSFKASCSFFFVLIASYLSLCLLFLTVSAKAAIVDLGLFYIASMVERVSTGLYSYRLVLIHFFFIN